MTAPAHSDCSAKLEGDLCFIGEVPQVCRREENGLTCAEAQPYEIAVAHARRSGPGVGWYAAAGVSLGLFILALVLGARGRRAPAVGLGGATIAALMALSATYPTPAPPPRYLVYPAAPSAVLETICPLSGTRPPPPSETWTWGLRFPVWTTTMARESLLVSVRTSSPPKGERLLVALDADTLEPLWFRGPCRMQVELTNGFAVLINERGTALLDGDGIPVRGWHLRGGHKSLSEEQQNLVITMDWGFGPGEVRGVVHLATGEIVEQFTSAAEPDPVLIHGARLSSPQPSAVPFPPIVFGDGLRIYALHSEPAFYIERLETSQAAARFPATSSGPPEP